MSSVSNSPPIPPPRSDSLKTGAAGKEVQTPKAGSSETGKVDKLVNRIAPAILARAPPPPVPSRMDLLPPLPGNLKNKPLPAAPNKKGAPPERPHQREAADRGMVMNMLSQKGARNLAEVKNRKQLETKESAPEVKIGFKALPSKAHMQALETAVEKIKAFVGSLTQRLSNEVQVTSLAEAKAAFKKDLERAKEDFGQLKTSFKRATGLEAAERKKDVLEFADAFKIMADSRTSALANINYGYPGAAQIFEHKGKFFAVVKGDTNQITDLSKLSKEEFIAFRETLMQGLDKALDAQMNALARIKELGAYYNDAEEMTDVDLSSETLARTLLNARNPNTPDHYLVSPGPNGTFLVEATSRAGQTITFEVQGRQDIEQMIKDYTGLNLEGRVQP